MLHQGDRKRERVERIGPDRRRIVEERHVVSFRCIRPHGSEPVELLFDREAAAADLVADITQLSPSSPSPTGVPRGSPLQRRLSMTAA